MQLLQAERLYISLSLSSYLFHCFGSFSGLMRSHKNEMEETGWRLVTRVSHSWQDVTILIPRRLKKLKQHLQRSSLRCDRGFQRIRWPGSHSWPQWSRACRNRCSCPDQCCYKWLHSCRACGECSSWDLERHSEHMWISHSTTHGGTTAAATECLFCPPAHSTLSLLPVFFFFVSCLSCSLGDNCNSVVVSLPQWRLNFYQLSMMIDQRWHGNLPTVKMGLDWSWKNIFFQLIFFQMYFIFFTTWASTTLISQSPNHWSLSLLTLVAEESSPALLTVALPGLLAGPVEAARVTNALVAVAAFESHSAPVVVQLGREHRSVHSHYLMCPTN